MLKSKCENVFLYALGTSGGVQVSVLIKEIAAAAGVSITTVSRVLNSSGYVGDETRSRVKQAMNELKYSPNLVARSLVTKQSNTIGLMIPHIDLSLIHI